MSILKNSCVSNEGLNAVDDIDFDSKNTDSIKNVDILNTITQKISSTEHLYLEDVRLLCKEICNDDTNVELEYRLDCFKHLDSCIKLKLTVGEEPLEVMKLYTKSLFSITNSFNNLGKDCKELSCVISGDFSKLFDICDCLYKESANVDETNKKPNILSDFRLRNELFEQLCKLKLCLNECDCDSSFIVNNYLEMLSRLISICDFLEDDKSNKLLGDYYSALKLSLELMYNEDTLSCFSKELQNTIKSFAKNCSRNFLSNIKIKNKDINAKIMKSSLSSNICNKITGLNKSMYDFLNNLVLTDNKDNHNKGVSAVLKIFNDLYNTINSYNSTEYSKFNHAIQYMYKIACLGHCIISTFDIDGTRNESVEFNNLLIKFINQFGRYIDSMRSPIKHFKDHIIIIDYDRSKMITCCQNYKLYKQFQSKMSKISRSFIQTSNDKSCMMDIYNKLRNEYENCINNNQSKLGHSDRNKFYNQYIKQLKSNHVLKMFIDIEEYIHNINEAIRINNKDKILDYYCKLFFNIYDHKLHKTYDKRLEKYTNYLNENTNQFCSIRSLDKLSHLYESLDSNNEEIKNLICSISKVTARDIVHNSTKKLNNNDLSCDKLESLYNHMIRITDDLDHKILIFSLLDDYIKSLDQNESYNIRNILLVHEYSLSNTIKSCKGNKKYLDKLLHIIESNFIKICDMHITYITSKELNTQILGNICNLFESINTLCNSECNDKCNKDCIRCIAYDYKSSISRLFALNRFSSEPHISFLDNVCDAFNIIYSLKTCNKFAIAENIEGKIHEVYCSLLNSLNKVKDTNSNSDYVKIFSSLHSLINLLDSYNKNNDSEYEKSISDCFDVLCSEFNRIDTLLTNEEKLKSGFKSIYKYICLATYFIYGLNEDRSNIEFNNSLIKFIENLKKHYPNPDNDNRYFKRYVDNISYEQIINCCHNSNIKQQLERKLECIVERLQSGNISQDQLKVELSNLELDNEIDAIRGNSIYINRDAVCKYISSKLSEIESLVKNSKQSPSVNKLEENESQYTQQENKPMHIQQTSEIEEEDIHNYSKELVEDVLENVKEKLKEELLKEDEDSLDELEKDLSSNTTDKQKESLNFYLMKDYKGESYWLVDPVNKKYLVESESNYSTANELEDEHDNSSKPEEHRSIPKQTHHVHTKPSVVHSNKKPIPTNTMRNIANTSIGKLQPRRKHTANKGKHRLIKPNTRDSSNNRDKLKSTISKTSTDNTASSSKHTSVTQPSSSNAKQTNQNTTQNTTNSNSTTSTTTKKKGFFGIIKSFFVACKDKFVSGVKYVCNGIKSGAKYVWNGIRSLFSSVWNGVVVRSFNWIKSFFK